MENETEKVEEENDKIGFKCLHYSVTESSGFIEVTVLKKFGVHEVSYGVRTVDNTAKNSKEYNSIDKKVTMKKGQQEEKIKIEIFDNNEWQPDLDFMIELYDLETKEKLFGDDTTCKVTILDEDFPGTLGFSETEVYTSKYHKSVTITVNRNDGSDGKISCRVKTEALR